MEKAGKPTPHNIKNRGEPTHLDFDESTAKVEVNSKLQEPTTKVAGIEYLPKQWHIMSFSPDVNKHSNFKSLSCFFLSSYDI